MAKETGQNIEERMDELNKLDQKEEETISALKNKIVEASAEKKVPLPDGVYLRFKKLIDDIGGISSLEELDQAIHSLPEEEADRLADFLSARENGKEYDPKQVLPAVFERYNKEKAQTEESELKFSEKKEPEVSPKSEQTKKEAWKKDYYAMLGVPHDASEDQIQEAFDAIHADYFGSNKRLLSQVEWVYIQKGVRVLLSPKKREKYDESLSKETVQKEEGKIEPKKPEVVVLKPKVALRGGKLKKKAEAIESVENNLEKVKERLAFVEKVLKGVPLDRERHEKTRQDLLRQIAELEGGAAPQPEPKPEKKAATPTDAAPAVLAPKPENVPPAQKPKRVDGSATATAKQIEGMKEWMTPAPGGSETLSDVGVGAETLPDGKITNEQKKEDLRERLRLLNNLRTKYKATTDPAQKEAFKNSWHSVYNEFRALYQEVTGRELREHAKEFLNTEEGGQFRKGKRFVKREDAKKEFKEKAEAELKQETPGIRRRAAEQMRVEAFGKIGKRFLALEPRERAKYKNKDGVIDLEVYKKALEYQRFRANRELRNNVDGKGNHPELSEEVFYDLMERGYEVDKLKGRILGKDEGRGVFMSFGGVAGMGGAVMGGITFGPFGLIAGIPIVGVGLAGEKFLPARLYGGVKLPKKGEWSGMSQEDFDVLVAGVKRDQAAELERRVKEGIQLRREEKMRKVVEKLDKGQQDFNKIKQAAIEHLVKEAGDGGIRDARSEGVTVETDETNKRAVAETKKIIREFFDKNEPTKENLKILENLLGDKTESPLYLIKPKKLRDAIVKQVNAEVNKIVKEKQQALLEEKRLELESKGVLFPKDFYNELIALGYEPQNVDLNKGVLGLGSAAQRKLWIPHKDGSYLKIAEKELQNQEKLAKAIDQLKKRNGKNKEEKPAISAKRKFGFASGRKK